MSPLNRKQTGRIDSMMLLCVLALLGAMGGFAYNLWQMTLGAA